MKRNIIHIMIALFAIIGTQSIYAQRVINQQGGDITINEQTHHVDGEESYTNFTITAPSAGNYYINFWVLPTEYANGTYSRYKVLVNGNEAGYIAANCGNWQSLSLENNAKVYLNKGTNTISIVSQIPEVTEVSHVSCAKVLSRAQISCEAYTAFLEKARSGNNPSNPTNPSYRYKCLTCLTILYTEQQKKDHIARYNHYSYEKIK